MKKMNWNWINSFKAKNKQGDKLIIDVRFGKFTLFQFDGDISNKKYRIIFFNLGVELTPKK